jgi:hypothetical protein
MSNLSELRASILRSQGQNKLDTLAEIDAHRGQVSSGLQQG